MNNRDLIKKLGSVSSNLLRKKGYISFVDIFMSLGYLDQKDYENWRNKKVPFLESVIKVSLSKINLIMKTVRKNSLKGKLKPSLTFYKAWGKGPKIKLQFSKSRNKNIEVLYATHFVSKKARKNNKNMDFTVDQNTQTKNPIKPFAE